ncbi:MAG: hypothetical protein GY861_13980 [bacterium]|nr:hypothetical protein [bacterium]
MITYEFSQAEINAVIKNVGSIENALFNPTILNKVALDVKQRIKLRTQGGKDKNYKAFKKYSTGYSSKKGKTLVNLTDTGGMLNSMTQKVMSNDTAKIFLSTKEYQARARFNIDYGRDFWGVNAKDRDFAFSTYQKATALELAKKGVTS